MALADDFKGIVDRLPSDWTDLQLDLRIDDEDALRRGGRDPGAVQRSALLAAATGTGACWSPTASGTPPRRETVHGVLGQLDEAGITGELVLREVREGRVEVVPMWGRPQSVREEFAKRRAQ